jgi:SPOR domain
VRIVIILLLLANLALFALTRLDSAPGGEAQRLAEQVQPDKLKLLTPQQVAALGPAKVASLSDVCVEWGPMSEAERTRAMTELAPLGLGPLVTSRRVDTGGYSVTLGGFPTQAAAERRMAELRARGITDLSVVDLGRGQYVVSLGIFRTEVAANGRADALAQQGITGARVAPRPAGVQQTVLVIRDPPQAAVARLRELAPAYSGTEIRVGGCERTS